jgi:formylglycine-generating enzyme required for sulfatase activity
MAWYAANSNNLPHPVGQKQPNGWGLYDMSGNILEWVMDYSHDSYNGAPTDGAAWLSGGDSSQRVLRGGSWQSGTELLSSDSHTSDSPERSFDFFGVRVVAVARS